MNLKTTVKETYEKCVKIFSDEVMHKRETTKIKEKNKDILRPILDKFITKLKEKELVREELDGKKAREGLLEKIDSGFVGNLLESDLFGSIYDYVFPSGVKLINYLKENFTRKKK